MSIEVLTTAQGIAAVADEWDALANADPRDAFFRTSRWYQCWMQHIRPDAEPFVVVVRDSSGTALGIAPLCRMEYRDRWLPLQAIAFAGREVVSGDYLDWPILPEHRSLVIPQVLEFLWEQRAKWSLLLLGELFEDSDLHQAARSFATSKGLRLRHQEERLCPFIELPATFDEYLANGFSQKRRKEIKRQLRILLEDHGASLQVFSGADAVHGELETLARLHTDRWESASQTGNLVRPGFAKFLEEICAKPPAGSTPRLLVIHHDAKPAAALLLFHSGQSALAYSIGRDPASKVAHLSPGYVLLVLSIRDAIQQGLRYYDFLRGDERHKTHLTKTARTTVTLLMANSLSATAYLTALDTKDAFKTRYPTWWARLIGESGQRLPQPPPAGGSAQPAAEAEPGAVF